MCHAAIRANGDWCNQDFLKKVRHGYSSQGGRLDLPTFAGYLSIQAVLQNKLCELLPVGGVKF